MDRIDELLNRWQIYEVWVGYWDFWKETNQEAENVTAMFILDRERPGCDYRRLAEDAKENRKNLLALWQNLSYELAELRERLPGEVAAKMYRNTSKPELYTAKECAENITLVAGLYRAWQEKSKATKRRRKPRAKTETKEIRLTDKERDAVELLANHQGNYSAAARAAVPKISRTGLTNNAKRGMAKLDEKSLAALKSKIAVKVSKPKTQTLPKDKRGQANIADPNAIDLNASE